ncbi:monovalent cation/H+ antiporter subunit D [Thauera sinica]|uniref:Monovalent cation/H+ antiporter subunit D n=1 Tax=Thauera sinica TaxID=2665146 RepID=A0ABW1AT61_9RHOO|nr:monovalent cation/H+ antiporter subunit D [Thauera sp. K11]ATE58827.1 monovalent cation/H+ antiporter subunit D [Thauera sp. K11]
MNHWIALPILLPALVGAVLVLVGRRDWLVARVLSVASCAALLVLALSLLAAVSAEGPQVYALGDWPAPYGIVLVLDRLAASMLALADLLALLALLYAIGGADRGGWHFHALWQFQLMGINGAFLTGDLFNLFVFFQVLLIASCGLVVHGGGRERLKAGVQYAVVNLFGSMLFLLAAGLIYGVTGTLNMADLAVRVPESAADDRALLHTGALLLLLAFGLKAALVPVHFWLPGTCMTAPAPVAALFAITTKVGAYAIIRLCTLAFGDAAGASSWLATPWLLPAAMLTLLAGTGGVLGARSLAQLAAFAMVASMGTLLMAVALFTAPALSAGLYYLAHSTLATAALFLLAEQIALRRGSIGDRLDLAPPVVQAPLLGGLFFAAAIAVCGMPPLSGFIGTLLILDSARESVSMSWIWGLILGTSLLGIIGFSRAGSLVFWKSTAAQGACAGGELPEGGRQGGAAAPPVPVLPLLAMSALLAGVVALTVFAGPVSEWLDDTAAQVHEPAQYIDAVLGAAAGNE